MKRIILTGGGTAGHVTQISPFFLVLRNSGTISNILVLIRESKRNLLNLSVSLITESLRENYDAISAYRILLIHSVYLKAFVKPIN